MKTGPVPQSGASGNTVASRNTYGQYVRQRPSRKKRRNKRRTADTDRAEGNWRAISDLWNSLSESQYRAWEIASEQERSRPRMGQSGRLPARTFFFKINNSRASLNQPLLSDPPAHVDLGSNPVGPLHITNPADGIQLNLTVLGVAPEFIKVYASPPQNRGRHRCHDFRLLGLLPLAVNGQANITLMYQLKYGLPQVGQRVFIRTVVCANGRQGNPRETSAVVLERERPSATSRKHRTTSAPQDV